MGEGTRARKSRVVGTTFPFPELKPQRYIPSVVIVPRLLGSPTEDATCALIVGQYPLVVAALARLLSDPPLNLCVELSTRSDDALSRVDDGHVGLLLCDLRSPPVPGPEVATRLSQLAPGIRVVLMADEEDASLLLAALDCGAAGFFTKDASPEEFQDGIQAVMAGHYAIGKTLARQAIKRLAGAVPAAGGLYDRLSPSEREVLALVGQAQSTRAIAAGRGISEKTVRHHLAGIYRKLGVRNRSEAIIWSIRMGRAAAKAG